MRQGQRVAIALLGCLSWGCLSTASFFNSVRAEPETPEPETTIERIARTGVLTVGVRPDVMPFSYINDEGEWVGYSVDMIRLIQTQLEQQLDKNIRLEFVPLTSANRFSSVIHGEVDIYCGATSFTWSRDLDLDFSVGYFVTGTQLLVNTTRSLGAEFRVGIIPNTTTEQVIEHQLPLAQTIKIDSRATGVTALERGRIDALASDGILLEGLRRSLVNSEDYALMPAQPYDREIYACVLPQESTKFQELVNSSLVEFMQGVVNRDSRNLAIFESWFGEAGVTPADAEQLFNYFQQTIDAYEQKLTKPPHNSTGSDILSNSF